MKIMSRKTLSLLACLCLAPIAARAARTLPPCANFSGKYRLVDDGGTPRNFVIVQSGCEKIDIRGSSLDGTDVEQWDLRSQKDPYMVASENTVVLHAWQQEGQESIAILSKVNGKLKYEFFVHDANGTWPALVLTEP